MNIVRNNENTTSVTAGLLKDWLKGLGKALTAEMKDVAKDIDRDIKDVKEQNDGLVMTVFPDNDNLLPYQMRFDQWEGARSENDDYAFESKVSFRDPSGKVYENAVTTFWGAPDSESDEQSDGDEDFGDLPQSKTPNVNMNDFELLNMDEFNDVVGKFEDRVMVGFPVAASLKIELTRKDNIVAVSKVYANYSPIRAQSDIDCILDETSLVDSIVNEGETKCYEVTQDEDSFDLKECDDFACMLSNVVIAHEIWSLLCTLSNDIEWAKIENAHDTDLINKIDMMGWNVLSHMTYFAKYLKLHSNEAPNANDIQSFTYLCDPVTKITDDVSNLDNTLCYYHTYTSGMTDNKYVELNVLIDNCITDMVREWRFYFNGGSC